MEQNEGEKYKHPNQYEEVFDKTQKPFMTKNT